MKRAHHFDVTQCADPKCGPHFIAYDAENKPFCEITMTVEQTRKVIAAMQGMLYSKVTDGE
jgi:hypothetical protein